LEILMPDPFKSWNLMHSLSERILQANSATEELERWCRDHAIGDGHIVALCARRAPAETLDDESREAIYPCVGVDHARFRKVRLATAGIVVADAFNWFFPDNLTPDICDSLETTNIPFGRAIRHLNPRRRTFLVRRCTPGQLVDADQTIDPTSTAFEHRAIVYRDDNVPLALVHERFRAILVLRMPELVPTSAEAIHAMRRAGGSGESAGGLELAAGWFRKHLHDFDVVAGTGAAGSQASHGAAIEDRLQVT
jgi:chorismate-pyruvate lyase